MVIDYAFKTMVTYSDDDSEETYGLWWFLVDDFIVDFLADDPMSPLS